MSLSGLLDKYSKQENFADKLCEEYSKPYYKRFRSTHNHVTNVLSGGCDDYWSMIKSGDQQDQEFSASRNLIFARGEAFHTVIKEKLCNLYPGRILGRWIDSSGYCNYINYPGIQGKYEELVVTSSKYKIVGHVDLCYLNEENYIQPLEAKSMSAKMFEKLRGPVLSHKRQSLMYAEILEEDTDLIKVIEESEDIKIKGIGNPVILYLCSEYMKGNPFKTFNIDRDYKARLEIKALMENNLKSYQRIIGEK